MATPYSPPKSKVTDPPEAEHPFPKPLQVRIAVALLWISILLVAPTTYVEYTVTQDNAARVILLVFTGVMIAFACFLNVKISSGRNWARVTFLIVLVLSWILMFLPGGRDLTTMEIAVNGASAIVDAVAAYLLFTRPGALWFLPRSRR